MYGDPNGHKEETAIEWLCNWLSGKSKKKEGSETEKIVIKDWGTKEDEERWNLAFEGKTEEFRQAQKEKYEELVDEALVKPVKMVASIAIGFTPADIVKDSADFIEGKDTFTGDPMSRWAMGAMLFLPEAGDQAVRQIAKKKAVKSIAKKAAKNVIDDVIDYADIAYTTKKVSDIDLDLNLGAAKKTQYTRSIVDETDDIIKRTGVSKVTKGAAGSNVAKGWKVGDPIDTLTKAGNQPSWSAVRQRYWKNEAFSNPKNYSSENIARMQKGLAPQRFNELTENMESMELHHIIPQRSNLPGINNYDNLKSVWPDEHQLIDPYRNTGR